jgi:NAD(P)-dependent dehydrogenase (short-subunit alcohol dehydrogenase family)
VNLGLRDKVAVVTGGASGGLGETIAIRLLEEGAKVLAVDLDSAQSRELIHRLAGAGPVAGHVADISTPDFGAGVLAAAQRAFGGVDVVVNNAAIYPSKPWDGYDVDEFSAVLNTNLRSLFVMAKAVVPSMIARGGGSIVNIGSISAQIVNRPQWQPGYNASKAAVHHLTRSLAAEWAPLHIRVNAIAPGYVHTEMAPVDRPEFRRYWVEDAPQQRYATPEEIAPSVVYLASAASAFMTGSVLVIDGGYTVF